jgi:23S rRNA pseudouridine1911/1915/1917 synthase
MAKRDNLRSREYFDRRKINKYSDYPVKEDILLMDFLTKYVGGSRTHIKELLTNRLVYVDNKITTQYNTPLKAGQLVKILKNKTTNELHNKYVRVVYEDAFLLVVDKKSGILTNSIPGSKQKSVKTILDEYVMKQNKSFRVHTVHRLDRDTSGLLVFAKRRDIQQIFTDNWSEIVSDRRYIAVVEGKFERTSGRIQSWLKDNKMFVTYSSPVDNGGMLAITNYSVVKYCNGFSLIQLKLETGRKNQIRVHMQDEGHPVVGDFKYGSQFDPIGRLALHAFRLVFYHPITNELLKFEIPYPPEFMKLVAKNAENESQEEK